MQGSMLVIAPRADASIRPYSLPGVGFSVFLRKLPKFTVD